MSTLELCAEYCIVGSDLYHKIQFLLNLDLFLLLFKNHMALQQLCMRLAGPEIALCFLRVFVCLLVCLCICTYHVSRVQ